MNSRKSDNGESPYPKSDPNIPVVSFTALERMIILMIIIFGITSARAQNEATISKISAVTNDSIEFQVFGPPSVIKGSDIRLDYVVVNRGHRPTYLVTDPLFSDFKIRENWIFQLIQPVVGPDDHQPFNYEFIKIRPQGEYRGKIVLSKDVISTSGLQNLSSATIRIGFSYLFDISNFGGCKQATYRLPCLSDLYEKSKSLTIGNLIVEIRKP
jgi:hypothetical protein